MEFSRDRMYPVVDGKNPITGEPVSHYPSVTTITGLMNKPFLIQAAVDVAVDYISDNPIFPPDCGVFVDARVEYRRQWDEAALFGTKVHAIAEKYFHSIVENNNTYYLEDDPQVIYTDEYKVDGKIVYADHELIWDELFRKVYKGLHDWSKRNKVVPISMEEVVYGDGYAGRYDLVCLIKDVVTMIDVKTGKGSYYPAWMPQVAGYRKCEPEVQAHGFLKWNKDTEKWNYKDFSENYLVDLDIFLAYRNIWWYNENKKQSKKDKKGSEQ